MQWSPEGWWCLMLLVLRVQESPLVLTAFIMLNKWFLIIILISKKTVLLKLIKADLGNLIFIQS